MNQQNADLFSRIDVGATEPHGAAVRGADNLILSCLRSPADMNVLLVCEDPSFGWYDAAAPDLVHQRLKHHGAKVSRFMVGLPTNSINSALEAAINDADAVIFFARIGDQGVSTALCRPSVGDELCAEYRHAGQRLWNPRPSDYAGL